MESSRRAGDRGRERFAADAAAFARGFVARVSMPTVDVDDLVAGRVDLLLDATVGRHFRGDARPVDRVAGHIPGAVSAPATDNLGPDGCFRSVDEFHEQFGPAGRREPGRASCRVLREWRDGRPGDPRHGARRAPGRPLRAFVVRVDRRPRPSGCSRRRVRALRSPCQLRACQYARRRDIVEPARRCSPHVA